MSPVKRAGLHKLQTFGPRKAVGSRAEVLHGNAKHTTGGLTIHDIDLNKRGEIVSLKKSRQAKKDNFLGKAGFVPKKGEFRLFRKSDGYPRRRSSSRARHSPNRRY